MQSSSEANSNFPQSPPFVSQPQSLTTSPNSPAFKIYRSTDDVDGDITRTFLKRFNSEPVGLNFLTPNKNGAVSTDLPPSPNRCRLPDLELPTASRSRHHSLTLPSLNVRNVARSRLENIRKEFSCRSYVAEEAANEKLVKSSQQVSANFNDFCLEEIPEERKRTKSLTEPISILTNAFLPHSCSPSPTRVDSQKQWYSPSTQQVVRSNIPYSPSPSPTPSPTRRLMRSLSPIAVRSLLGPGVKRRFPSFSHQSGGDNSDAESGSSQSGGFPPPKRLCGGRASPLVNEKLGRASPALSTDSNKAACSSMDSDSESAQTTNSSDAPLDPVQQKIFIRSIKKPHFSLPAVKTQQSTAPPNVVDIERVVEESSGDSPPPDPLMEQG